MRSSLTRGLLPALAVGTLVLAACGSDDSSDGAADTTADSSAATAPAETAAGDCAATIDDGVLTIATGEPAFPPWVIDDAPESGEGFEAAVAYAVAAEMGYDADSVVWVRTTFDEAIQPGAKSFDLNLQQYSITEERAESIDFSLVVRTIVGLFASGRKVLRPHEGRRCKGHAFAAAGPAVPAPRAR